MINENIITLSNHLRKDGMLVSIRSSITAAWILENYPQLQYEELRSALKCIYVKNKEDELKFDRVFDEIFKTIQYEPKKTEAPLPNIIKDDNEIEVAGNNTIDADISEKENQKNLDLINERRKRKTVNDKLTGNSVELLDGYDSRVFDICQRLSKKIANQRTKRKKRQKSHNINFPSTIRHNLKNGGHLINLIPAKPPIRKSKQIILSDVSGSCEWVSTWFFSIIYGCYKTFDDLTLYDFDNKVVDVTDTLGKTFNNAQQINHLHQEMGMRPYGQSDMGTAFKEFLDIAQLNNHTDVIILTDCRDWQGDIIDGKLLSETLLKKMVQKSRNVYILNPEKKIRWSTPTSCVSEYERTGAQVFEACTLNQFADIVSKL